MHMHRHAVVRLSCPRIILFKDHLVTMSISWHIHVAYLPSRFTACCIKYNIMKDHIFGWWQWIDSDRNVIELLSCYSGKYVIYILDNMFNSYHLLFNKMEKQTTIYAAICSKNSYDNHIRDLAHQQIVVHGSLLQDAWGRIRGLTYEKISWLGQNWVPTNPQLRTTMFYCLLTQETS